MNTNNILKAIHILLPKLAGHLELTGVALLAGCTLACSFAILCKALPILRPTIMTLIGMLQTLPSLALLAMMVPLTGQFGFVPAVCALTLYSVLPILQNILLGFDNIHPNLHEAGLAVGMKPWQRVVWIDVPLTLPFAIAGLRTATVWTVGAATLSTPVGQTSLGNLIFTGLQIRQWDLVMLGCSVAALLAILLDHLLLWCSQWWQQGAYRKTTAGLLALIILFGSAPFLTSLPVPRPTTQGMANTTKSSDVEQDPKSNVIAIGTKTFTEQFILGSLLEQTLQAQGFRVERIDGLGSTMILEALAEDTIQLYIDYAGTLWAHGMRREDRPPNYRFKAELAGWLAQQNIDVLLELGFENAYALMVHRDTANRYQLKTIADIVPHAARWTIAGDYEIFHRREWQTLKEQYQLQFAQEKIVDPTFLLPILQQQEADVLIGFTTDGGLQDPNIVVLHDTHNSLPPYQAYLLLSPKAALNEQLRQALLPLAGKISTQQMQQANGAVEQSKQAIAAVAQQLLQGSLPPTMPVSGSKQPKQQGEIQ